jgi:hypothetical protein
VVNPDTFIELTTAEIIVASQVGLIRQCEDIKANKKPFVGESQDLAWQRHIEGALSECAMAKYLNIYWNKSSWPNPDVGNIEVRVTHYKSGKLIIRPADKDDVKYYLLTGINGKYNIRGYIYAIEGKQDQYLSDAGQDRPKVYFVPQSDLHPIERF